MRHEAVLVPVESMNHSQERERERDEESVFTDSSEQRKSQKQKDPRHRIGGSNGSRQKDMKE